MATIEEMVNVLYDVGATPLPRSRVKESLKLVLRKAEEKGQYYNSYYHSCPCIIWEVRVYHVIYHTTDWDFTAEQLSYDDMDDLIIEEV